MDRESNPEEELDPQLSDSAPPDQTLLETQLSQLRLILEVSRSLNSTLDLDTLLDIIIKVATEVTFTEVASILLMDEKTGELRFEAATGAKRAELKTIAVPLEGSIAGWIVSHNRSLVVNDARQDPRHFAPADETTQFDTRSVLGAPLQVKDKTIGVLEVLNKCGNSPFITQDLETLETLAAQAAIAIENARLYQDLQDQMRALREAQTRLVQSEKLAAVGELVAGVAHELNNPLTSVIGFAHMLQRHKLEDKSRKDLDKIIAQAQRAATIVHGLLDFARQRPPEQKPVQINSVLNSTLELLGYELRTHNVLCSPQLSHELPLTMADPYQLQQVFVNLVNNARQAMSDVNGGGHLAITTELAPSTFINQHTGTEPVIRVIIQDDGPGIPSDLLSSIFDPFFTTKPEGHGTGLGLSVCHGIVSEHGGHIWADSETGHGATFYVELPVVVPEALIRARQLERAHGREETPRSSSTVHSEARVLVIDDEISLLDFLTRVLQREGYQVDAVGDGETGLTHLANTDYELVVCDIRMPGLSGLDVYRQVKERNPILAQRFIFITGDSVSRATQRFLAETGSPYLCKPFGPTDLTRKIRAMVNDTN